MREKTILLTILVAFIALGFSGQDVYAQGQIIGQVIDARGNPVGGVDVAIQQIVRGDRPYTAQTETDRGGLFEFNRVPAGNYVIMARSDAGCARAEIEVQDREVTRIRLQLEGRGGDDRAVGAVVGIVQAPNGDPFGGAVVTLQHLDRNRGRHGRMLRTESDRRGMFYFVDIPVGNYIVTATVRGGIARARLEVIADQRNRVRLVLQRIERGDRGGRGLPPGRYFRE
ncbi:carboxypeptidase regulatory-like domain-containing protein [bacterium]|nr:carboxypeptidase regulatory-like domain-containing protein [bacterium]